MFSETENELRDKLFEKHSDSFFDLVDGRREPCEWDGAEFPPLSFVLKRETERRINKILDKIQHVQLYAKEIPLIRGDGPPTRIDLLGGSERAGIVIIELKKSNQTERQAFTEILAYSNHFCLTFPGLTEAGIVSVLVAPMLGRTVRDAYIQELLINRKDVLVLCQSDLNDSPRFSVYYPTEESYAPYNNILLNDQVMSCITISFQQIPGRVEFVGGIKEDTGFYLTADFLNHLSSEVSISLERLGFHALVYCVQKDRNCYNHDPELPNILIVAAINPFALASLSIPSDGESRLTLSYKSLAERMALDPLEGEWIDRLNFSHEGRLQKTVIETFDFLLRSKDNEIRREIEAPSWTDIKWSNSTSIDVIYFGCQTTGMLKSVLLQYIEDAYEQGHEKFGYFDDLPLHACEMTNNARAVLIILDGLGGLA